jgi:asparagine synthase (glutamine-hydrolysing)
MSVIDALPPGALGGRAGRLQRFGATLERGMPGAYLGWVSYIQDGWRERLLTHADDWARQDYERRWQASAGARTLDRLLSLNIETYLLDDLLVKMDRMSMAHGLEVRSPFLDTQLLEFATRLSPALKLRGLSLKRVLKHALTDLLPRDILSRPKRGFGVPLDRWFRDDLASYTASMLGKGARVREHLNSTAVDRLLAEHGAGVANHGQPLWTLLTLELFLRRHGW